MNRPEVAYGNNWWPSLTDLQPVETRRVADAVHRFITDPNHPGLNLHPIHAVRSRGLHSFRASDELRVLIHKAGNTYVMLEAGHHDDVYSRAERGAFVANPQTGFIGMIETTVAEPEFAPANVAQPVEPTRRPLDHWNDQELTETGMTEAEVALVRGCNTEDDLCNLPDNVLATVLEIIALTPNQWRNPGIDAENAAERQLREIWERHGVLAGFTRLLDADEAVKVLDAPIEDWMVFLHPDQRDAVLRRYEGPARIRGSAGTGKTVVGLHRAAELARRYEGEGKILFTTFVSSLPPVFEHLYRRIPGAKPEEIEFVNVDKLARAICTEAGVKMNINTGTINSAMSTAWKESAWVDALIEAGVTQNYAKEEIDSVIKGRGITTLDEYLEIERTGRRRPFPRPLRVAMFDVYSTYQAHLAKKGVADFADCILAATKIAASQPPQYRCAIIDEAQDISLAGLGFVRTLVNGSEGSDRSDGLLIVGDGAQRIYPGGFTLRQAGIEVRGRTTVLRTNYRNTQQVVDAAVAVAGDVTIDDLGEEFRRADADHSATRIGIRPVLAQFDTFEDELDWIAQRIQLLSSAPAIGTGDIAIAVGTNTLVRTLKSEMTKRDVPVQELRDYQGSPTERVKIGTHHRIKGLEFKVVFLPGLSAASFPSLPAGVTNTDEQQEHRERALSQLFVAMTRARDQLIITATGNPTDSVFGAIDHFDVVDGSSP